MENILSHMSELFRSEACHRPDLGVLSAPELLHVAADEIYWSRRGLGLLRLLR